MPNDGVVRRPDGLSRPSGQTEIAVNDCWRALMIGQSFRFCALPHAISPVTFKVLHVTQTGRLMILINGRTTRAVDAKVLIGCYRHGVIEPV